MAQKMEATTPIALRGEHINESYLRACVANSLVASKNAHGDRETGADGKKKLEKNTFLLIQLPMAA